MKNNQTILKEIEKKIKNLESWRASLLFEV